MVSEINGILQLDWLKIWKTPVDFTSYFAQQIEIY